MGIRIDETNNLMAGLYNRCETSHLYRGNQGEIKKLKVKHAKKTVSSVRIRRG